MNLPTRSLIARVAATAIVGTLARCNEPFSLITHRTTEYNSIMSRGVVCNESSDSVTHRTFGGVSLCDALVEVQ